MKKQIKEKLLTDNEVCQMITDYEESTDPKAKHLTCAASGVRRVAQVQTSKSRKRCQPDKYMYWMHRNGRKGKREVEERMKQYNISALEETITIDGKTIHLASGGNFEPIDQQKIQKSRKALSAKEISRMLWPN